jgi:hypothetical protein
LIWALVVGSTDHHRVRGSLRGLATRVRPRPCRFRHAGILPDVIQRAAVDRGA